jgi:hypothetical protein
MLPEVGVEPANSPQRLSISRRAGLVGNRRVAGSVTSAPTSPWIDELPLAARVTLTGAVTGQVELLEGPVADSPGTD